MFASLQEKLESAFRKIRGKTVLGEKEINETMREVRMALLEADVHYKVAKDFCATVAARAVGEEIGRSLTPDQQIIKICYDELVKMMGSSNEELAINVPPPAVIMLVGLQGSGKTTTASKLAKLLKEKQKKTLLLVPADVYRPAAIDQLKSLGKSIGVDVFDSHTGQNPVDIARTAKAQAAARGTEVVIIDTAGRLQIDTELMDELKQMHAAVQPNEIILVVDAMTGQEAVNVAQSFDTALNLTGLALTKLDGDARGGAALSVRAVTGKPIKLIGVSEKPDGLEPFHPDRLASRILGMGDVLSLIEKATEQVSIEDSEALQKKLRKNEFSLEDFLSQLRMVKKMGSVSSLASMIPGMDKLTKNVNPEDADKEMKRIEAIILSMTPKERKNPAIMNGSRRRRVANGSGTSVEEINRFLRQFTEMKKMMTQVSKMGMGGLMKMMRGMGLPGMPGMKR